jgi:hypothetical protein
MGTSILSCDRDAFVSVDKKLGDNKECEKAGLAMAIDGSQTENISSNSSGGTGAQRIADTCSEKSSARKVRPSCWTTLPLQTVFCAEERSSEVESRRNWRHWRIDLSCSLCARGKGKLIKAKRIRSRVRFIQLFISSIRFSIDILCLRVSL